ncbi:MAG: VCBS repeat-containing protein [Verrucomicrobia bacterium]|nr:MAG: VCBS repeat-containing protein [Verrucomicrobiota bacterium]
MWPIERSNMMGRSVSCFMAFAKSTMSFLTVVVTAARVSSLFHTAPAVAGGSPAPNFTAPRAFDAGGNCFSVAVGDFNGDGASDLAVADFDSDQVSVLLSKGDGTFQPAANYAVGMAPVSVAVADFNGDGKPDLVAANDDVWDVSSLTYTNGISVLLGKGDGSFQPAISFGAGTSPGSVAAGDFNSDGKPDLVVANLDSHNVSMLLGNGDGTFRAAVNYGAGMDPVSVAVGDFNGDGKLDLAVANYPSWDNGKPGFTNGAVSVLLGKGDGSFRAAVNYSVGISPVSIAVSDFNGDGKPDLAVANFISGDVSVLLGKGDGTFQAAVNYVAGIYPVSVAVGDFNDDGRPDLVVANEESDNVSVLLAKGDGIFQAAVNYCAGAGPRSVAVGDFNKDGKTDLIVANWFSHHVSMLLGKGDGTFQSAVNYTAGSSPVSVSVADFNGDGKPDLAVANDGWAPDYSESGISVLLGDGDAVVERRYGSVSVLLGKGDATFQTAVNYRVSGSPVSIAAADFDGDGKPDLAVANQNSTNSSGSGNVSVLLGRGDGTFQTSVNYGVGTNPVSIAAADFNGDGKPDLVVANGGTPGSLPPLEGGGTGIPSDFGSVSILSGNGDGTFQTAVNFRAGNFPVSVAVGDFNGDGKPDLVVANNGTQYNYSGNGVSVLFGRGDGTFPTLVNYGVGKHPVSVAVADFNGDDKADIAVAELHSGDISVLTGNGDGIFQAPVNYAAGGPWFQAVGDFNGDGKPDIAVANLNLGTVSVLLNISIAPGIDFAIQRSATALTFSWPLPSAAFVLESVSNLGSTNWQRAAEVPSTNSGRLEIIAPPKQPQRFFRLRKP